MATKIVFNPLSGSFDFSYRPAIGDIVTSATQGSVFFAGASGAWAQDNTGFYYDDSTNTLKVTGGNVAAYQAFSGTDAVYTGYEVGMTAANGRFMVAGGANQWFVGSVKGDIAIRQESTSNRVLIGADGAAVAAIAISNTAVTTNLPTLLADLSTAVTQAPGDNTTKIATTAFVTAAIGTVNSLSEVLALGNTTGTTDIIVTAGQTIKPSANDGAALGVSGTAWSDLFLASGAVLNFGAGEVTLTEAANTLTLAPSSGNMNLDIRGDAPSMWFSMGAGASSNGSFAFKRSADNTYKWAMIGYGDSHATFPNGLTTYQFTNAAGSAVSLFRMVITDAGNVTFGGQTVASAAAKLNVLATTEQLRLQYDVSNYYSTTVGSTGIVTFNAVGSGSSFRFSDMVKVDAALGGTFFAWGDSGASNAYRAAFNLATTTADLQFFTASGTAGSETFAERMRIINASGILTIGGTVAYGREGQKLEVNVSANDGGAAFNTWAASNEGGILDFNKSRSATIGTHTIVQDGDALGGVYFRGSSGSAFVSAAAIVAYVDGTPGASNDMPGVLAFYTTANASGSLSERMRIENNGYTGIGTNDPQTVLHVFNGSGETFRITNTAGAGFYCETRSSASSSDIGFATLGTGKLILRAGGDTIQITSANAYFPTIGTTASAANAYLNSGSTPANELLRSTSSRVYKKDIENMDHAYADNILKLRPVWYRSKCANDPENFSYWGLIAEEVAEIDPRLVQWGYHNDDWIEEVVDEDGKVITPRTLKEGAEKKPDGVTYDRLTVLLIDVIKRQEARIQALEAKLEAIK